MREIYLEHVWDLKGKRMTMNTVKDSKSAINMAALLSWSRFAMYKEDEALRDKKKWKSYNGYWPVLWEMTIILAKTIEDAGLQQINIVSTMQTIFSRVVSLSSYVDGWAMKTCWVVVWVNLTTTTDLAICRNSSNFKRRILCLMLTMG